MDASQTHEAYAHKLRDALSRRDAESFASQYAELMGLFLKGTKLLLLQLGFEEQQLV